MIPPITRIAPFFLSPPPPPYQQIFHPKFSLLTEHNCEIKLNNAIHEKQHVGFFIFKFALKYMLGNIYINKIHAMQCLCNKCIL